MARYGARSTPGWDASRVKAGIVTDRRGAHILRHSLAARLLRSGETLKSIGDLLGHRRPDTTFIYTKLQAGDLRSVALDPAAVS
jgi:site-specific recombinase XerD